MKNVDGKKLVVFILIVIALVGIVFLIFKATNKDKLTKEEKQNVENSVIDIYLNMTSGYSTMYGGLDVLYSYDKLTVNDLKEQELVYTAINYLNNNNISYSISGDYMEGLKESNLYGSLDDYRIYKGESVRQAIKDLFGLDNIPMTERPANFLYDIYYNEAYDCYLLSENTKVTNNNDPNTTMDFSIISTEKKDGKLETTVAIAYVFNNNGNIMYLKDPKGVTVIAEGLTAKEFPKDKIDEFDKYKFILNETSDKKYTFESVEKIN